MPHTWGGGGYTVVDVVSTPDAEHYRDSCDVRDQVLLEIGWPSSTSAQPRVPTAVLSPLRAPSVAILIVIVIVNAETNAEAAADSLLSALRHRRMRKLINLLVPPTSFTGISLTILDMYASVAPVPRSQSFLPRTAASTTKQAPSMFDAGHHVLSFIPQLPPCASILLQYSTEVASASNITVPQARMPLRYWYSRLVGVTGEYSTRCLDHKPFRLVQAQQVSRSPRLELKLQSILGEYIQTVVPDDLPESSVTLKVAIIGLGGLEPC
ncbi:hypothetical protein BP5796_10885 [Coleophoma crateriformis]|uniref:Uncharacterized protein n=1 Tax=Coleophoma crateriformis TaxID=565419 RepID=A0A3D8QL87_9HELO|nr:hypothetical protein BP5796_10885 [Coleophoma crateriformis]